MDNASERLAAGYSSKKKTLPDILVHYITILVVQGGALALQDTQIREGASPKLTNCTRMVEDT